jgi:formate dehydrogenase major subunit
LASISIDGQSALVPDGATILSAVRSVGKDLPTLCFSERLEPYGACRVCLVEVEGGKPVAACHTPVREGARYRTSSPFLTRMRRNIVELVVSDHPLDCLGCAANGRCDLQRVAQEVGFRTVRYDSPRTHNPPPDFSHPFVKMDMEKCIGCGRCVRACDEVQGSFVLGMAGRGYDVKVVAGNDTGLEAGECVSCGQCVFECPVGALLEPGTLEFGLPDRVTSTTCGFCGIGCSLRVHTKDGQVTHIEPDPAGSANRGHTCVKGRFAHQFGRAKDRLLTPLIRDGNGSFHEASWDEALGLVAERFATVRDRYGPDGFAAISSARCTNEENYLVQKFTRVVMGTNSVDNCARVCHAPSAYSLGKALGTGAGTHSFQDIEASDVLMIVGANPTEAHPVLGSRIKQAVLKGCRLIVLDPRNTALARLADVHLALRPGSNVAVINALQHVLIEEGWTDPGFIRDHTEGFEQVQAEMKRYTPEWAAAISGVPPETIRAAARLYGSARAAQVLWGLGVSEAGHGSQAAFGLVNMAVMTGNIGRTGTGASPIRGQNNVQGASDVGALPNVFSDYRPVTDSQARDDHRRVWGVEPPINKGLRIPDMLAAARAGTLKAMYIVGENLVQSDPNTAHVLAALESLDFLVVQELFLNATAAAAHVVLPGATFLEKDGTFVNSDRRIQRVRCAVSPPPDTRADGDIVNDLARRMGFDLQCDDGPGTAVNPARVMDEIARLTPKWAGVDYGRLDALGFLQWPCWDKDHPGTATVHENGNFLRGKAAFTAPVWKENPELPDEVYPLMLTTGRQLFHYNVATMTRRTDISLLDKAKEELVRVHPKDADPLGVRDGDIVDVVSRRGRVRVRAEVTEDVNPGTVFMTFHFEESKTNILISSSADEYTGCPDYKLTAVRIEK